MIYNNCHYLIGVVRHRPRVVTFGGLL